MNVHAVRLPPGAFLKEALAELRARLGLDAGFIVSAVGSLDVVKLRLAGAGKMLERAGPHEVVALSGTLSADGLHLHAALADAEGNVVGGHVVDGCRVYTTMELVIGNAEQTRFARREDAHTGYKELVVEPKPRRWPEEPK